MCIIFYRKVISRLCAFLSLFLFFVLSTKLLGSSFILPVGDNKLEPYSAVAYEATKTLAGTCTYRKDFGNIYLNFSKNGKLIKVDTAFNPRKTSALKSRMEQVDEMLLCVKPMIHKTIITSISKVLSEKLDKVEASLETVALDISIVDMFDFRNFITLEYKSKDLKFSAEFTMYRYENLDVEVYGYILDHSSGIKSEILFSTEMPSLHRFKAINFNDGFVSYHKVGKSYSIIVLKDDDDSTVDNENEKDDDETENGIVPLGSSEDTNSKSVESKVVTSSFSMASLYSLSSTSAGGYIIDELESDSTSSATSSIPDLSYLKKDADDFDTDPRDTTLSDSTTGEYTMTGNYLGSALSFSANVDIDGNGYALVNTTGSTGAVISLGSSADLSLSNLSITHLMDTTACLGIDINSYGTISSLDTVLFYNIEQYGAGANNYGVAIRVKSGGSIDLIENCGFDTNGIKMTASNSQYGAGIGIQSGSSIGTITNSYFTGNYIESTNTTGGLISGGAAIANNQSSVETISNCDFTSNYVFHSSYYAWGGAILNFYATIGSISGSNFSDNYVESTLYYAQGGAICNYYATITKISDSTFTNNSVESTYYYSWGGAICNYSSSAYIESISDTDFEGNYATNSGYQSMGGAIYNTGTIDIIDNANFSYNYVETGRTSTYTSAAGGAIYNAGTISEINNSTFSYNYASATSTSLTAGGAIYNTGTSLSMTDVEFTGNSADYGGAIYNTGSMSLIASSDDILISENIANTAGSFLYNKGTFDIKAESGDITISGNVGTYAIYNYSGTLNLESSTSNKIIIDDAVYNSTGVINVKEGSFVELNNALKYGTLNIDGDLNVDTSLGSIYDSTVIISNTGVLSTSADSISGSTSVDSSGLINLQGGTLSNAINTSDDSTSTSGSINILGDTYFNATTGADIMVFNQEDNTSVFTVTLDVEVATYYNEIEIYLGEDFNLFSDMKIELYNGDTNSIYFTDTSNLSVYVGENLLDSTVYLYEWYNDSDSAGIKITVIPEPSTYAMILALLSLAFVAYKGRK